MAWTCSKKRGRKLSKQIYETKEIRKRKPRKTWKEGVREVAEKREEPSGKK